MECDYLTSWAFIVGGVTFVWTIYQQFQISKMCKDCPYLPANNDKPKIIIK
jgi:hypothetical protein